mmetsp:Transcript_16701/g.40711  ORF Transcript_16701/g.40711 Transcript_16701/m.40711 type:complete len:993 (-) Transcript_16701:32-3010(-)
MSEPPEEPPAPEPPADTTFDLTFRVVSCRKLLKGDRNSSDPYVKIMLGQKELHRTKYLLKTLNPVFGHQHDNQFTAQINYGDLAKAGGVNIEVKDWDRIGNNDLIGLANIEPAKLLSAAKIGKPTTFRLEVPPGRSEKDAGFITLCVMDISDDSDGWSSESSGPEKAIDDDVVAPLPSMDFRNSVAESMGVAPPSYDKEMLIEIMSCRGLIAGDRGGTSDPYVEIKMGTTVLHKTLWIEKTLNPAYSVDHKNIYILKCSAQELWSNGGIELLVKDKDMGIAALGMVDDELGYVKIPPQQLYDYTGVYTELKLNLPRGSKLGEGVTKAGTISIRVRETNLVDKDETAAAEVEALGSGRNSVMVDDRAEWEAEAAFSTIKPKREKLYMEDSDSSSDSSDMYMDSSEDEGPPKKPVSVGAAAKRNASSDEEMPGPTDLNEQVSSKWGNQKGVGGRGPGAAGRGGRGGGAAMAGRGGQAELYVPSIHPGDMFDQEVEALKAMHAENSDEESLEPKENATDTWEQLVEKDTKIKELEQEVDLLKEQNKELRMELKRSRYTHKANKPPKKKKDNKIPLAKKGSSNSIEEKTVPKEEEKPKAEVSPVPKSALKKGKFSALDFDGPSDDEEDEKSDPNLAPKTKFGGLDFGLDAPTFSSDESDDDDTKEKKAPKRGVAPASSVVSPSGVTRGMNVLAPSTRGIPGVRLSEMEAAPASPGKVLSPSRGIPGVRMSEIEPETPEKRAVRFNSQSSPMKTPSDTRSAEYYSTDDGDSTDEELSPNRGLLNKMGLTDSVVDRVSLYSFIQGRPEVEDTVEEDTNDPPDFDRKHKDMEFAKLSFVGVAGSKDKEAFRGKGGINAMPSLAFNPSAILTEDEDSDEEHRRNMVGVSVDKDWMGSNRSLPSNLEQTTTTVLSQTAIQQTKISGRRVIELEQQVHELQEELELALANPGGYEKASFEVQLKVAKDNNKKLASDNERLQKMNKIQKVALFDMNKKHKGFW